MCTLFTAHIWVNIRAVYLMRKIVLGEYDAIMMVCSVKKKEGNYRTTKGIVVPKILFKYSEHVLSCCSLTFAVSLSKRVTEMVL